MLILTIFLDNRFLSLYFCREETKKLLTIIIPAVLGVVLLGSLLALFGYYWQRRAKAKENTAKFTAKMTGNLEEEVLSYHSFPTVYVIGSLFVYKQILKYVCVQCCLDYKNDILKKVDPEPFNSAEAVSEHTVHTPSFRNCLFQNPIFLKHLKKNRTM